MTVRMISLGLAVVMTSSCVRFDPTDESRVEAAMVAGGIALTTINKCLVHMEQAKNTSLPECDAADEMNAYLVARGRVKEPASAALQNLEQKIENVRGEAVNAVVRIALQTTRR